jgi:hypothetical protein
MESGNGAGNSYQSGLHKKEPCTSGAVVRQRREDGTPPWLPLDEGEEDIPRPISASGPP